jgi:DNA-binding MarR family transcriptional regulator
MSDFDPRDREHQLQAIHQFVELVVASSRSPRQRQRLNRAVGPPVPVAAGSLLRIISRHGPLVIGELAARAGLDQSTVSRQVRTLEDLGLVDRRRDPTDRRSSLVVLSAEGRRHHDRVRAVARNDYDAALADWDDADRATFAALLDRFRRSLAAAEVDERGWSKPRRSVGAHDDAQTSQAPRGR